MNYRRFWSTKALALGKSQS